MLSFIMDRSLIHRDSSSGIERTHLRRLLTWRAGLLLRFLMILLRVIHVNGVLVPLCNVSSQIFTIATLCYPLAGTANRQEPPYTPHDTKNAK